jgi:hypothetical protein
VNKAEKAQTDKSKRRLYDVFDDQGRWKDSFYLETNRGLLAIKGEFLFVLEQSEEGDLSVVKYRIID